MSVLESPPYTTPPVEAVDRQAQTRLPRLQFEKKWIDWLNVLNEAVDEKPTRKAKVRLVGQTASLGLTPLPLSSVGPGVWRFNYTTRITTPAGVSSSLIVEVTWTEGGIVQTRASAALTGNLTTTVLGETFPIRVDANTPISYSTTFVSTPAGGAYSLDVAGEELAMDEAA